MREATTTIEIHPTAGLRAASKRIDMLEGFYPNQVKILEQEKLTLEQRVAELEREVAELNTELKAAGDTSD